MLHNCLKCVISNMRKYEEDAPTKSNNMVKTEYKDRMDQLRPPKLTIIKRRMHIYWYHREN